MDSTPLTLIANQIPIIASILATGALLLGLLRRQEAFVKASLYLFVFAALAALPVYLGSEASTRLTLRALFGIEVIGLLALGALILSFQNAGKLGFEAPSKGQEAPSFRSLPLWAAGILAGLALLSNGVMVQTAYSGDPSGASESIATARPEAAFLVTQLDSETASENLNAGALINDEPKEQTELKSRSKEKTRDLHKKDKHDKHEKDNKHDDDHDDD